MAGVGYDVWAGYTRLAKAAGSVSPDAMAALAYHAALEREVDEILATTMPRSEKLENLTFQQKVWVLAASWPGDPKAGDLACEALNRFNALRNAHAHGDSTEKVKGRFDKLVAACQALDATVDETSDIGGLAWVICGYLGDGPTPAEAGEIANALANLMGKWGEAFAAVPKK